MRPQDLAELGDLGEQVGDSGRMGSVFRLTTGELFKRYETPLLDGGHLDALIDWRLKLAPADRRWIDDRCAWPRTRVVSDAETVGFTMACAPDRYWFTALDTTVTRELQHLMFPERASRLGLTPPTRYERLRLVHALAAIFAFFDRHKMVYADLSEKNLLWSLTPQPSVYLLDIDNISMPSAGFRPASQATARNWRDPRLDDPAISADVDSDRWALGTFFYRIFYALEGDQDWKDDHRLIRADFPSLPALERLLAEARGSTLPRPRASAWALELEAAATALAPGIRATGLPPPSPAIPPPARPAPPAPTAATPPRRWPPPGPTSPPPTTPPPVTPRRGTPGPATPGPAAPARRSRRPAEPPWAPPRPTTAPPADPDGDAPAPPATHERPPVARRPPGPLRPPTAPPRRPSSPDRPVGPRRRWSRWQVALLITAALLMASGGIGGVLAVVSNHHHRHQSAGSLGTWLATAQRGPVRLAVVTYVTTSAPFDWDDHKSVPLGEAALRLSLYNGSAQPVAASGLSGGPALLTTSSPSGVTLPNQPTRLDAAGGQAVYAYPLANPDRGISHLYGVLVGTFTAPSGGVGAGWAAGTIPAGGSFSPDTPGTGLALFLVPPLGTRTTLLQRHKPGDLGVLGVAFLASDHTVLGFTPTSAWGASDPARTYR